MTPKPTKPVGSALRWRMPFILCWVVCLLCDQVLPWENLKGNKGPSFWKTPEVPEVPQHSHIILHCFFTGWGWDSLGVSSVACGCFPSSNAGSGFSCFASISPPPSLGQAALYVSVLIVQKSPGLRASSERVWWGKGWEYILGWWGEAARLHDSAFCPANSY